ncbi:MAG: hypothetical protein AAF526_13480 [Pseudomonadota bacterium]
MSQDQDVRSQIDQRPLRISVTVTGKTESEWRLMFRRFLFMAWVLLIPTWNHFLLGGGWALDLFGAVFGLAVFMNTVVDIARSLGGRSATFGSTEEACEWLTRRPWKYEERP